MVCREEYKRDWINGGQENYLGEYLEIIPTKSKGNPRFSMYS